MNLVSQRLAEIVPSPVFEGQRVPSPVLEGQRVPSPVLEGQRVPILHIL